MIKYEVGYFGKKEISDHDKKSLVDIYQKLFFVTEVGCLANANDLKRKIKAAQTSDKVYQVVTLDILYAVIHSLDLKHEKERAVLFKLFNWHPELIQDFFDTAPDLNKIELDSDKAKSRKIKNATDNTKNKLKESLFLVPIQEAGSFSPAEFLLELIATNNKAFGCIIRNTESRIGLLARLAEYDLKNSTSYFYAILQDIFKTPEKSVVIEELKSIINTPVSAEQPTSAIRELLLDKPTHTLIRLFQDNLDVFIALYADNIDNLKKIFCQIPNVVQFVKMGWILDFYNGKSTFINLVTKHKGTISEAILEVNRNSENEDGVDHETFEYVLPYAQQLLQKYNTENGNVYPSAMRNLLAEPKLRDKLEFSKDTLQTMIADEDFGEENCRYISMSRNCWSKISNVALENRFMQARRKLEANRANIRDYVFKGNIPDEEAYLIRHDDSLLNELAPEKHYSSFWRPIKRIFFNKCGWFKDQFETEPNRVLAIYQQAKTTAEKILTEMREQDEARVQKLVVDQETDSEDLLSGPGISDESTEGEDKFVPPQDISGTDQPEIPQLPKVAEAEKISTEMQAQDEARVQKLVVDQETDSEDLFSEPGISDESTKGEDKFVPPQDIPGTEQQNDDIQQAAEVNQRAEDLPLKKKIKKSSDSESSTWDILDIFAFSPSDQTEHPRETTTKILHFSDIKNKDELSDEKKPKMQTFFSPEPILESDSYSTAPNTPQILATYSDIESEQGTPLAQAYYSGSEISANSTPLQAANYSDGETTPAVQAKYSDTKPGTSASAQGTPLIKARYSPDDTPEDEAKYSASKSESEAGIPPEPSNNSPRGRRLNLNIVGTLFTPKKAEKKVERAKSQPPVKTDAQDGSQDTESRKRSSSVSS